MGTFLDHLEDAARERRAREERERRERAETRADYVRRTASRGPERVLRSTRAVVPPTAAPPAETQER